MNDAWSPSIAATIAGAIERQRAGQSYGEAGLAIRTIFSDLRRMLAAEQKRGDVAAARLSNAVDETVCALFSANASNQRLAKKTALLAVGGFGRGALAPYSDIDLLFLHERDESAMSPLLNSVLYPLYDAGAKVGHAVHTPATAVEFAQKDMIGRTAYLDARVLAGDQSLARDFRQRFEKLRKRTKKQFFEAKTAEREDRHERSEQSRFLAEPDVKEGKGGLRDLHAMRWLYKYEYDFDIDHPRAKKKLLAKEDLSAFRRAERFLWSVRFQLHMLRGRAEEKLTFDLQPALAERLGYVARAGMSPAERLMRHYFVNAMEIGRLTRIFSAKLEEEKSRLSPKALKILPKALLEDVSGEKPNLKLQGGRLHFENVARARKNAVDHFRLFRAFARRPDFDFHPDALAVVSSSLSAITAEARENPVIARLFLGALTEGKDRLKLLRVMAETGLLGKYIPIFAKLIGRIEYGLYRRFSVDENVFQSIGVLAEIESGAARARHPIATAIVSRRRSLAPYYIAALLYETRWATREDSDQAAEALIARTARRLGLSEADADLAAWCAARPFVMVRTAERRNLSEPSTIARFAAFVETQERLDLLLVLSICHLRVVGAYSWDDQTRRQLSELYYGASAWLEGGNAALEARLVERAHEARAAAAERLASWPEEERSALLARLSDAFFRSLASGLVARIAGLARAAAQEKARAAVTVEPRGGIVEALVYADDRKGLLADLAGAVAAAGASVRSVQAMTTEDGKAIDIFAVQSVEGAPIEDGEAIRKLHAKLLAAALSPPRAKPSFSRRIGDKRALFAVAPEVRLDLDASAECIVVEAEGRDRPGLLYDLCAAVADLGLTIASAHIATYGARAVDAFYVKETDGSKPSGAARLKAIEARLLAALADGGAGANPLGG